MEPAKKAKVWMELVGAKLPVKTVEYIKVLAQNERRTKSAMVKFLVEIGLEAYNKRDAKDLAILQEKLEEIRDILER